MNKRNKIKFIIILASLLLFILCLIYIRNYKYNNGKNADDNNNKFLVEQVTISFVVDGEIVNKIKINKNNLVKEPLVPKKQDFEFIEWQLNGVKYDFEVPVSQDITLIASWKKIDISSKNEKRYTVIFNSNGGTNVPSQTIDEGSKVLMPVNPTKKGYSFIGWQLNGVIYDFEVPVSQDITLIASWKKIDTSSKNEKRYTVIFNSNGGTNVPSQTIDEGSKALMPVNPTKEGYSFIEWQLNGSKYDFSKAVTKNITLNAVWREDKKQTYTVIFDSNGGTNVPSQTIDEGSKVLMPVNPTKEGYSFIEWQLDGKSYNFDAFVNSNITLIAKWYKQYEVGDLITIAEEKFNVIRDNGDTIVMLAKYNINSSCRQTKTITGVSLCSSNGWDKSGENIDLNLYSGKGITRVQEYENYLKTLTSDNQLSATLLTKDDLIELGCSNTTCINKKNSSWIISSQPFWLRTTSHLSIWSFYYVNDRGNIAGNYDVAQHGIRPVVTISKNVVN